MQDQAPRFGLIDMHCHLDRMCNATDVAREAETRGIGIFCTTVTPGEAVLAQETFATCKNVRVGVGLHPWWVDDGRISTIDEGGISTAAGNNGLPATNNCDRSSADGRPVDTGVKGGDSITGTTRSSAIGAAPDSVIGGNTPADRKLSCGGLIDRAVDLVACSPYIGEVGLDFSPAHVRTRPAQLAAFERIIRACAENPCSNRIASIHAVRAAGKALDILERYDLTRSTTCVFHWFSGTSDDFLRLRQLGCCISVNERMLATRRGREYARQMPVSRLLIETDAPKQLDTPYSVNKLEASLTQTLRALARLRDVDECELANRIAQTSSDLLLL